MTISEPISLKSLAVQLFSSKWFISLVLLGLLVPLIPSGPSKYELVITNDLNLAPKSRLYYEDLDNDGESERLISTTNIWGNACVIGYTSEGKLINQWNSNAPPLNINRKLYFYDLNRDGSKEIFQFTLNQDSIELNIHGSDSSISKFRSFNPVDKIGNFNPEINYANNNDIRDTGLKALVENGGPSIYFAISAGFTGYPRNIYKLDPDSGILVKSEHLGNAIKLVHAADMDSDGKTELVLSSQSVSNNRWFEQTYFRKSDESSWSIFLDDQLREKFGAREFPFEFSSIAMDTIHQENRKEIIAFFLAKDQDLTSSMIYRINPLTGKYTDSIKLYFEHGQLLSNPYADNILVHDHVSGKVFRYDYQLVKKESIDLPKRSIAYPLDVNMDGVNEWVLFNARQQNIEVYSNSFAFKCALTVKGIDKGPYHFGMKLKNGVPLIWFQSGNKEYEIKYLANKNYFLGLLRFPLIYTFLLVLVGFIFRIQQFKEKKKRDLEEKIAELQLKAIKNQMDPHFVFNAMNTIAEMKLEDKLEVDQFICEFSDLMRKTISGSDKIVHSLREEIEYVKNYIRLQQIRSNNGFEVIYDIEENKYQVEVPRHIIYTYVENAIKHGFYLIEGQGILKIQIQKEEAGKQIKVAILNNGLIDKNGLKKSRARSTGSGLKLMENILSLYQERFNRKITVENAISFEKGLEWYKVSILIDSSSKTKTDLIYGS